MFSPSVTKETEKALDEVLQMIRGDHANPYPVLCETDRDRFVQEETSLREQLEDSRESGSSSWRGLLCLPSPQAVKCLENAKELRRRVKKDVNAKLRTMLTGRSHPPSPLWDINMNGTSTPKTGGLLAEGAPGQITYPLDFPSESGAPEPNDNSTPEASSASSDQSVSNSSQGRKSLRLPPPPPRRSSPLSDLRLSPETSSGSGSDSPRRASSVRRSPPPPPQSPRHSMTPPPPISTGPTPSVSPVLDSTRLTDTSNDSSHPSSFNRRPAPPPPQSSRQSSTPHSPTSASSFASTSSANPMAPTYAPSSSGSSSRRSSSRRSAPPPPLSPRQSGSCRPSSTFFSYGPGQPDPSAMSRLAEQMSTLASSIVTESLSGQGQQRGRRNGYVTKTNCLEITGSNVDGVTLNNGGSNNSGAVIHKTMMPPRVP